MCIFFPADPMICSVYSFVSLEQCFILRFGSTKKLLCTIEAKTKTILYGGQSPTKHNL